MNQARAASEPLLWLQLLGLSLLPLEALLILLLLAGSDPGGLPGLERLLCWALGGLAPALLLWRRPADVWSLLLVQTPARGRREVQRRLSALQDTLPLRIGMALGAALLLALLWRLDAAAALATALAPLPEAPRLVALLLSAPVLAVGLVVGLVVSILQAVTQIQEQTLVFVPKILAMVAATVLLLSWMSVKLMEFSTEMFSWSPVSGS